MAIKLAALFSDHMVLQRDKPIPVWGWAAPGEKVGVSLAGRTASATAAADGKWSVSLPPMDAGGPFELKMDGPDPILLKDVLVGEVWICSGQSNMAMLLSQAQNAEQEMATADYPNIRLFTVKRAAELEPKQDSLGAWIPCRPDTAGNFSAVGYFFGREIHRKLGVPVGLINASWGGTYAETWTSREALMSDPFYRQLVETYERELKDPSLIQARQAEWNRQYDFKDTQNEGEALGWASPDLNTDDWPAMDLPCYWQNAGHEYSGIFWFRKTVDLSDAWAGRELQLSLGAVDKSDVTYFNGVKVGSLTIEQRPDAWDVPRQYTVPGSLVKAGRNVIAVRVFSNMWMGGFGGQPKDMRLALIAAPNGAKIRSPTPYPSQEGIKYKTLETKEFPSLEGLGVGSPVWLSSPAHGSASDGNLAPYSADSSLVAIALAGSWRYTVERKFGLIPPPPPGARGAGNPNSPYMLFDNMLAPLVPYAMRGVIWYQGESNAECARQYQTLFPLMIRSWRAAWRQGDFPFLFVQLANFSPVAKVPGNSQWAELREAQTRTLALPNTGMAVTIDIGEAENIHPYNKKDVGLRLALPALAKTYGCKDLVCSGPLYKAVRIDGKAIRIEFEHVAGGLIARGGTLQGFTIAGDNRVFMWAEARIEGHSVVVSNPKVPNPVAVRYAWANNPDCNLFNASDLPASPFRTDDWPGITA